MTAYFGIRIYFVASLRVATMQLQLNNIVHGGVWTQLEILRTCLESAFDGSR